MQSQPSPLSRITLPGQRKRRLARWLLAHHHVASPQPARALPQNPIRVICVSDTHNTRPDLPPGDILIHAGDLTENGSFEEIQAGLAWLSAQPHAHKIFVAGNHDVLLDEEFLAKYPERRYGENRTRADLLWGDVVYLQDEAITLRFPSRNTNSPDNEVEDGDGDRSRDITIFGSPRTQRYGVSAFQYSPAQPPEWASLLAGADIVVTHGPPHLHLDTQGIHRAGCMHLADAVGKVKPRLVVFGHIHASHGREDLVLDWVRRTYEDLERGWAGWEGVLLMAAGVGWAWVRSRLGLGNGLGSRATTFVNASVVGGRDNGLRHGAIVVEI